MSLNASAYPRFVNEAPWYRSCFTSPISCKRTNMLETEAGETESRAATSLVEAASFPPRSHMALM